MDSGRLKLLHAALGAALGIESGLSLGMHAGIAGGWVMCVAAALAASRTLYVGFVGCGRPKATAAFTALRAASGAIAVAFPVRGATIAVGAATILMIGSSMKRKAA